LVDRDVFTSRSRQYKQLNDDRNERNGLNGAAQGGHPPAVVIGMASRTAQLPNVRVLRETGRVPTLFAPAERVLSIDVDSAPGAGGCVAQPDVQSSWVRADEML
jgi:hypothetical protein